MNEQTTSLDSIISEAKGAYRVNLPVFEGPLDLLLYLIRKHELSIHDISIAVLTEEYLRYVDTMQALDIDLAGEFLVMAAELMHIKSQMLLPVAPALEDDTSDPRADLMRRLLEYQRFKEAAAGLEQRHMLQRDVFVPLATAPDALENASGPAPLQSGTAFMLIEAFDRVLRRIPTDTYHTVAIDRVSVNQRIYELAAVVRRGRTIDLEELLPKVLTKYDLVVTFLSLLEMARLGMITLFQGGLGESLFVTGVMDVAQDAVEGKTSDWR